MIWFLALFACLSANAADYQVSAATHSMGQINAIPAAQGDRILFKRGDRWDGTTLILRPGVVYCTYGSGNPPLITRGKVVTDWQDIGGIWVHVANADVLLLTEDGMVLPYASDATLTDGSWYLAKSLGQTTIYYRPTPGAAHKVEKHDGAAIIGHNATGATLDGLEIFGAGLYARNASGLKVRRCRARLADFTIVANGQELSGVEVSDSVLLNPNEGIYVGSEQNQSEIIRNVRVLRNVVLNTGLLYGGQSWLAIKKRDREAIGLQNMVGGLISGNVIIGGAYGGAISYWSSQAAGFTTPLNGNVLERNYIDAVQDFGIAPGGAGFGNNQATVRYNQITRTGHERTTGGGLRLNRPQMGSPVYGNSLDSILFSSLPENWTVYGNVARSIAGNAAGNTVGENQVYQW